MLNVLTGNTTPKTYTLRAKEESAWIDVDNNGKLDDHDAYLTLETGKGSEYVDIRDLRQALKDLGATQQPADDKAVLGQLRHQYNDDDLQGFSVINGAFNFEGLTTYRNKQTFALQGEDITYTLQFDPDAPLEQYRGTDGQIGSQVEYQTADGPALVKDQDGILHWAFPEPTATPEPPAGAVTEPTLVQRDGILHWLFPGEVPAKDDKIMGNADTAADAILKG